MKLLLASVAVFVFANLQACSHGDKAHIGNRGQDVEGLVVSDFRIEPRPELCGCIARWSVENRGAKSIQLEMADIGAERRQVLGDILKDGESVTGYSFIAPGEWSVASPGKTYQGSIDILILAEVLGKYLPLDLRLRMLQEGAVITKSFPVEAFRLVQHERTEPAGAGQPATRPVGETKGGDKPQPEAEGRSR